MKPWPNFIYFFTLVNESCIRTYLRFKYPFIYIELKEGKRSDINTRKCMLFALPRMLLSASICLSTLQKHEGDFVLILKSAWGVLSTLYFWAWGVLSAFKKTCGGFRPPITKWTWGVLSVGCFVLHSHCNSEQFYTYAVTPSQHD